MFELGKGDNLPFSPVLMLAWVQLPCGVGLVGTESTTFRAVLGGEQGCPFPRKGMQILFKGDKRRLTKYEQVWALSAQPFPSPPASGTFYPPPLPPLNYLTGVEIIVGIC